MPYAQRVLDRPAPALTIVSEDLDDDVCLYRPDIDEVLVLNQSAGDVWRLADGELTVAQIVELLASSYGTSAELLSADVRGIVDDLYARGYLVDRTPASTES